MHAETGAVLRKDERRIQAWLEGFEDRKWYFTKDHPNKLPDGDGLVQPSGRAAPDGKKDCAQKIKHETLSSGAFQLHFLTVLRLLRTTKHH
jgi:hypothetical protein